MPIPNIDVSLYPGLRSNLTTPPRISTRAGLVDGSRGGGGGSDPIPQGVIFQSDFRGDAGYSITGTSVPSTNAPLGFSRAHATGNSLAEVVTGAGPGGKNAMRLRYGTNLSQPNITLIKELTDGTSGYPEIYLRFKVKFADAWQFGDGLTTIPYWKWFRLAQNFIPGSGMTPENREDSYYVVGTSSFSPTWGSRYTFAMAGNEEDGLVEERAKGSAGGPHATIDWYIDGNPTPHSENLGYFNRVPGWDIDWTTNPGRFFTFGDPNEAQQWRTIEFRVKCASAPGADDGVVEMFFDGENQGMWRRVNTQFAALRQFNGPPTAANPNGFNWVSFFDNTVELASRFAEPDVDGWIDIADLVVSTTRIGHNYEVNEVIS